VAEAAVCMCVAEAALCLCVAEACLHMYLVVVQTEFVVLCIVLRCSVRQSYSWSLCALCSSVLII